MGLDTPNTMFCYIEMAVDIHWYEKLQNLINIMNLILKKETQIACHSQSMNTWWYETSCLIVSDSGFIKNKMHFPKYLYMYVDYPRCFHAWWPVWISDLEKSKNTCLEHISTSFIRVSFSGSLCFDWGPHRLWKHDRKYIQVMVAIFFCLKNH
jgi:hypothetical protein